MRTARNSTTSVLMFGVLFGLAAVTSGLRAQAPQQPSAPTSTSPYTIRTGANRVLVDIVVKDKHGAVVHGLKQTDFTVLENGQVETIKSFDEHVSLTPAEAAAAPSFPALPPGQFTNFVPVKQSSALTVILFDRLNTGVRDQAYVRSQLLDYLNHARPDARIAIFGLTDHLILLKGFTSNPADLLAALDDKGLTRSSPLRDDVNGGGNGVEDLSALLNLLGREDAFAATQAAVQSFQNSYQGFQQQIQAQYTLDALNGIARSLAGVAGRKNLIWFTGNFPEGLFPGDATTSGGQFASLDLEYEQTVNLLTATQIAIYPVDAQGVRTNAVNNAGLSNPQYGRIKSEQSRQGLGVAADTGNEDASTAREHLGEEVLARDTGGEAFYNHNDLNRAVDEAINSGSNYYTVSYAPANPENKVTFRRIEVKIAGQSYNLSYRRGYYTDVPTAKASRTKLAGAAEAPVPSSALRTALLEGGPTPTEILLRVKAGPADGGNDAGIVNGNSLNPDPAKSKGPYRVFQIDYATSMRAISIRKTSDNLFHADLDFVAYVYDGKGQLVNAQSNTFRGTFTAQELADTLRGGLPFTQKISVPEAGTHTLRVAVHDNIGDKVGAVEIPVAVLKPLPLVTTPASAQLTPDPAPALRN